MELKVFWRDASTAQSAAGSIVEEREGSRPVNVEEAGAEAVLLGPAMQNGDVLFTQKTSRQQAVTPRLGGRFVNFEIGPVEGRVYGLGGEGCDCRRTRTTSRGVTLPEYISRVLQDGSDLGDITKQGGE